MSVLTRLAIVPRDGLFCKDGRGWATTARAHSLEWPFPSTVLGALRTAWGRAVETEGDLRLDTQGWREHTRDVRLGRNLALQRPISGAWSHRDRVWPVPSDALWLEGHAGVVRLQPKPPRALTLGSDDDDAREALWVPRLGQAGKPLARPRWWAEDTFVRWLCGEDVAAGAGQRQLVSRLQSHVGIRASAQTAEEGALFCHEVFETLDRRPEAPGEGRGVARQWAIGCELELPRELPLRRATLGSDGRIASLERLSPEVFEPPPALLTACEGSPGLRLVVVTPAEFSQGWLPDGLERCGGEYRGQVGTLPVEVVLRAALVPRPLAVSGWDIVAGKPKKTTRLVAAGAVYFIERADGRSFSASDAQQLWFDALGHRENEGFGRVVPGRWNPKED